MELFKIIDASPVISGIVNPDFVNACIVLFYFGFFFNPAIK